MQIGSHFAPGALYIDEVYPAWDADAAHRRAAPLPRVRVLDASGGEQGDLRDLGGA